MNFTKENVLLLRYKDTRKINDEDAYHVIIDWQGILGFDNKKVPFVGTFSSDVTYTKNTAEKVQEAIIKTTKRGKKL